LGLASSFLRFDVNRLPQEAKRSVVAKLEIQEI
jgi:hypothetical protein